MRQLHLFSGRAPSGWPQSWRSVSLCIHAGPGMLEALHKYWTQHELVRTGVKIGIVMRLVDKWRNWAYLCIEERAKDQERMRLCKPCERSSMNICWMNQWALGVATRERVVSWSGSNEILQNLWSFRQFLSAALIEFLFCSQFSVVLLLL